MNKLVLVFALVTILTISVITTIGVDVTGINNFKIAFAQIQAKQSDVALSNLIKQDQPYQGIILLPVSLIMFGDFQCHDCDRFVKYTEPQINSTYIKPGKVALVIWTYSKQGI